MARKKQKQRATRPVTAAGDPAVSALRNHVVNLLTSTDAHLGFDDAIAGIAPEQRGVRPAGAAHTAWQLVEHLRICLWDFVEFCRNPKHVSPTFPAGYWPTSDAPPDDAAWQKSVAAFRADMRAMARLVSNPRHDLFARVDHPEAEAKHTLLREALVLADHNAYHIGQLVLLRRLLKAQT